MNIKGKDFDNQSLSKSSREQLHHILSSCLTLPMLIFH